MPTGYIQDMPSKLDLVAGPMSFGAFEPPAEHKDLANAFNISLQQQAESCVGFSIAEAIYASWRVRGADTPALASPLFIWWNSRQTHGDQNNNSGTYIRSAIKQLKQLGFCPESKWPSTAGKDLWSFMVKPSRIAYRAAYDQKMNSLEYYRIAELGEARKQSWKKAIAANYPIVFGVPVEEAFLHNRSRDYYKSPSMDAKIIGGHAMCALGYDERGVFGPQTWGAGWGREGWFYLEWEYITEWALDQWVIRAPEYFSEV